MVARGGALRSASGQCSTLPLAPKGRQNQTDNATKESSYQSGPHTTAHSFALSRARRHILLHPVACAKAHSPLATFCRAFGAE